MSWSVSAFGRPKAVAAKLQEDFSKNFCFEPEETIRQAVAKAVAASLAVFPDDFVVRVEASGSQYTPQQGATGIVNQLSVKIEPLYGFLQ